MTDVPLHADLQGIHLGVRPEFDRVVHYYRERYPGKGAGVYSKYDWNRLLEACQLVVGDSVLDVGVGNGAFLKILAESARFRRVAGLDIRRHSMLIVPEDVELRLKSVTEMDFADGEFDTVVCMEVLEHLEVADLPHALHHLRRVAASRLICTVPYNEPFPWYGHDKPGGHRQNFDDAKLATVFPHAVGTLVPSSAKAQWVMMVEDTSLRHNAFRILSLPDMRKALDMS